MYDVRVENASSPQSGAVGQNSALESEDLAFDGDGSTFKNKSFYVADWCLWVDREGNRFTVKVVDE